MSKFFALLFFVACSFLLSSQSKLDSLRQKLQSKNLHDTTRANIYHDMATIFEEKAEDSCLFYGNLSLNISIASDSCKPNSLFSFPAVE